MQQVVTYYEKGEEFKTYKLKRDIIQNVLIKKSGKPFKIIRFNLRSGRMLKPSENF